MFNKISKARAVKNLFVGLGVSLVLAAAFIVVKDEVNYQFFYDGRQSPAEGSANECLSGGNVALVKIHGSIVNYKIDPADDPNGIYDPDSVSAEDIVRYLDEIGNSGQFKGIIMEIDSPGGTPTAGEEIMNALRAQNLPVAAFIRERGLSAGYMIATAADTIYASRMSDVGSIGVTMSYLDYSKQNNKDGLTYNQLSTGKFKDAGDPDKELTAEEKTFFMADLKKAHDVFVGYVAENRGLDIEAVKKLANGSSMIAQDALAAGLIDAIGGLKEAEFYIAGKIDEEVAVCNYAD